MTGKILIYTCEEDAHADVMIEYLAEIGRSEEVIRLNTEHLPMNIEARLEISNDEYGSNISIKTNGRHFDIGSLKSVWFRKPQQMAIPTVLPAAQKRFIQSETRLFIRSIWDLSKCFWMDRIPHMAAASVKPEQLRRAVTMGFSVPHSIITNDYREVLRFFKLHNGRIIFKALEDEALGNKVYDPSIKPKFLFTSLVEDETYITEDIISLSPCLFQEYIDKQLELRITVVGNKVFTAAMYTNDLKDNCVDSRFEGREVSYSNFDLPTDISEKCVEFVRSYGLNYGAIDMIVTPENKFVFLEINPGGQFYYIQEKLPNLKILETVAQKLIEGH